MIEGDTTNKIHDTIIRHLVGGTSNNQVMLEGACLYYGVNLDEFKKEHSEEIVFAMLQKGCYNAQTKKKR